MNDNEQSSAGPRMMETLRDSVQQHPLAAGLIGAGALLMLLGSRRSLRVLQAAADDLSDDVGGGVDRGRTGLKSVSRTVGDAVNATTESIAATGKTIAELGRSVGGAAASTAQSARSVMGDAVTATSSTLSTSADTLSSTIKGTQRRGAALFGDLQDVLQQQPLALGAIGLALGSAVAASLPTARLEVETFGEASAALKRGLRERASDQAERLTRTASTVAEAIREESRQQGLTPERLRGDLENRASELSDAFGASVKHHTSG